MEKYAVFTTTTFKPCCELSISNKIVEKVDLLTIRGIVENWIKKIFPDRNYIVYYLGNFEDATIDRITMYDPTTIDDPYKLIVVHKQYNVRLQIGTYETKYDVKEV